MTVKYTDDYLLDKKIKIFQPENGYRTSSDAVLLSSLPKIKSGEKILDVGSGTGGISLCLAHRTKDFASEIIGIELQKDLAELADMSAKANNFADFLQYINADIREKIPLENCTFHHVITNPPYAQNDMPSPNESKAFAHNHHDFSLKKWLEFCLKMLRPFGFLYVIHRAEALSDILFALHKKTGNIQVFPLYSKKGQAAKRVMIVAQKDSKTPLKIHPPFVVHADNGEYTAEAELILRKGEDFFTATQTPLS